MKQKYPGQWPCEAQGREELFKQYQQTLKNT